MINEYIAKQFGNPTGIGGLISTFVMNSMNRKQYKSVIDNLMISSGDKILDLGFGNAKLLNKLSKVSSGKFYGLEYSEDMYKRAKNKFRYLNLKQGDIIESPYENQFFDGVYTVNTVYFWSDINKGLSEIKRNLKNGGVFINVFYSKRWLENIKYTDYGFNRYAKEELLSLTIEAGFEEVELLEISKDKAYCLIAKKI
ncbi:MAG: class I SAM-dependent methyltransferase [Sarcina sp.]